MIIYEVDDYLCVNCVHSETNQFRITSTHKSFFGQISILCCPTCSRASSSELQVAELASLGLPPTHLQHLICILIAIF